MTRAVADDRLEPGLRSATGDHHEALHGELLRIEPEDETLQCDVELYLRGLVHTAHGVQARLQVLGKVGARQVGDVALEDAEVGAPDVDQVACRPVDALRDGEQRHDQSDAERDPGRREERARGPAEEVLADEPEPGHNRILLPWAAV